MGYPEIILPGGRGTAGLVSRSPRLFGLGRTRVRFSGLGFPAARLPRNRVLAVGDVGAAREYDRCSDPGVGIRHFGEEVVAEQRGPHELEEIERHDRAGIGLAQRLGQQELRPGAHYADEDHPHPGIEARVLPDIDRRPEREERQEDRDIPGDRQARLGSQQQLDHDHRHRPDRRRCHDHQRALVEFDETGPHDNEHAEETQQRRRPPSDPHALAEQDDAQDGKEQRRGEAQRRDLRDRCQRQARERISLTQAVAKVVELHARWPHLY